MRRLFGAVSLRSVNPCSVGTPPPCGGTLASEDGGGNTDPCRYNLSA